jgi:hypothetical protein
MNRLLIVAILAVSTSPLYAQGQQQNVAKFKEDARNVVGTIANDKGDPCSGISYPRGEPGGM